MLDINKNIIKIKNKIIIFGVYYVLFIMSSDK